MAKPYGLPKGVLLRSKKEISTVFRDGRYHALGTLHVKAFRSERKETRFLISVKKAIGNAPRRNRIKRLVRESMRLHMHELKTPHDICFFLTAEPKRPLRLATVEQEIQMLFLRLSQNR